MLTLFAPLLRALRLVLILLAFIGASILLFATPSYAVGDGGLPTVSETSVWADSASWLIIAGLATPWLTSVVQRPQFTGLVRTVIGVVVSVVIGVLTLLANGTLTDVFNDGASTWLSLFALIVLTSATSYKMIWQPSGVAPKIEIATTPPSKR